MGGAASSHFGELDGKAEPYRTVRRQSRSRRLTVQLPVSPFSFGGGEPQIGRHPNMKLPEPLLRAAPAMFVCRCLLLLDRDPHRVNAAVLKGGLQQPGSLRETSALGA